MYPLLVRRLMEIPPEGISPIRRLRGRRPTAPPRAVIVLASLARHGEAYLAALSS
jgi:hypothetical protein